MNRHLLLGRLQCAAGLAFLASFVVFAVWGRFPAPYRDDWDWLYGYLTRPLDFTGLFEPHNEHLIPLPRLLLALQYTVEGTAFRLSFAVALAAQLLIGWIFWRQIRGRWEDRGMRAFAWGLAAVPLFVTYQLQSIVFVAAILFPLVQLFAVWACHAAAPASEAPERRWLGALISSVAAALTTTNGLIVPGIVALLGLTKRPRARVPVLAAFIALQGVCIAAYVLFVGRPWDRAPAPPGQGWTLTSLGTMAEFFLSFFSSGLLYGGRAVGAGLGTLVFTLGCWCLLRTARDGSRARTIERFACGLLLFTIASAVMTTIGRAQFGVVQAAQSRYATYTFVYWSAVVIWMLSRFDVGGAQERHASPLMALAVLASVCGLAVQTFIGLVWIAKKDNIGLAALTLATGVDDDEWVSTLHPLIQPVYRTRALLVADDAWRLGDPRMGTQRGLAASVTCEADLRMEPANIGLGWRVNGTVRTQAGSGVVVDRSGISIGVVIPAPTVAVPNPSQLDVVRAVWRRLSDPGDPSSRWLGFARLGAGAPYTFFALDRRGQPVCEMAIPN